MKRSQIKRKTPLRRGYPARRKFGNAPKSHNGIEYHSGLEARYAAQLDLRKAGIGPNSIRSWRRQVPIKLEVNGALVTTYIVDFVILHRDGHEEYVEVKGFETPEWKIKHKLFRALFPSRLLTVVKVVR